LEAVTGRKVLYYSELRHMIVAENIVTAYRNREASTSDPGGWGKWAQDHPALEKILIDAEMTANA
jgi:hypothetical protein